MGLYFILGSVFCQGLYLPSSYPGGVADFFHASLPVGQGFGALHDLLIFHKRAFCLLPALLHYETL